MTEFMDIPIQKQIIINKVLKAWESNDNTLYKDRGMYWQVFNIDGGGQLRWLPTYDTIFNFKSNIELICFLINNIK